MTTTIHVDKKQIVLNNKTVMEQDEHGNYVKRPNETNPPIVVEKNGFIFSAHEIEIQGPSRVVYDRKNPHPSTRYPNKKTGITVWIETESEVIKIK